MTRMRHSLSIAAAGVAFLAMTAASAQAKQIKFSGTHPIPAAVEGDFCYIEVPHVHVYEPEHPKVLYRVHDDYYHFVGDPVAFGYDGPTHTYYGHHPVVIDPSIHVDVDIDVDVEPVTEYCYLEGPHFHDDPPPAGITFELHGDAYWYIGKYPPYYHKHRKVYEPIDVVYQPIEYERPVVAITAPAGYIGPVVKVDVDVEVAVPAVVVEAPDVDVDVRAGAGVRGGAGLHGGAGAGLHGGAGVRGGIEVHVPVPTIEFGIGVSGGVRGGVGGHTHGHRHKHKKVKKSHRHKRHH
jgi:hypothetical protein